MSKIQQLKQSIRNQIREQRNCFDRAESLRAGQLLSDQVEKNQLFAKYQNISCFLSFDGEISTQAIIARILAQTKNCFLPKLKPNKPNRLWFMPYNTKSKMTNNRYGIAEVDLPVNRAIAVSKLEIVFMPLVAFDNAGNRLGMGGGYYDATFAHLKNASHRPLFIGLAYESQKLEKLPCESWDLPLDGVCTEANFYQFG